MFKFIKKVLCLKKFGKKTHTTSRIYFYITDLLDTGKIVKKNPITVELIFEDFKMLQTSSKQLTKKKSPLHEVIKLTKLCKIYVCQNKLLEEREKKFVTKFFDSDFNKDFVKEDYINSMSGIGEKSAAIFLNVFNWAVICTMIAMSNWLLNPTILAPAVNVNIINEILLKSDLFWEFKSTAVEFILSNLSDQLGTDEREDLRFFIDIVTKGSLDVFTNNEEEVLENCNSYSNKEPYTVPTYTSKAATININSFSVGYDHTRTSKIISAFNVKKCIQNCY